MSKGFKISIIIIILFVIVVFIIFWLKPHLKSIGICPYRIDCSLDMKPPFSFPENFTGKIKKSIIKSSIFKHICGYECGVS
jgi:hypothetical protein